jgi:hypothetical protein
MGRQGSEKPVKDCHFHFIFPDKNMYIDMIRSKVLRLPDLKKEQAMKRTTHRSSSGKKLYAVRDSKGRFKDIQTYERAHRADLKKKSKAEKAKAAGKK